MKYAALKGWAIARIPPTNAPQAWFTRRDQVNLISVSNVVLQEDFVDCMRCDTTTDWPSTLKL
ncbi:MAG: hypothetical protein MIO90_05595 [Methanomassiliicoccales archaeon]|nr:hypothetical protein [Methanomassiliicoccales archaeon]